jgi:type IV pilus assembly protein PilY1
MSHKSKGRSGKKMKKWILFIVMTVLLLISIRGHADDTDLFIAPVKPNILIIVDNSNSMDEDFYGNAVGSFSPASKSVVGKKALRTIIDSYKNKLNVRLMSYNISGVSGYYLHNSPYFVSYDPKSYCPNPPPECVQYAQTGDGGAKATCISACQADNPLFDVNYFDEILNNYGIGTEPHTRYSNLVYPHNQKRVNPADPGKFIYYKHAYPFYSGSNQGTAFCYGTGYSPNEGPPWDSRTCWSSKTGTNDDYSGGYSGSSYGITIVPTDSDYALGYADFGMRLSWYYVGRTWFASGSPGNGYLHVPVDNLVDKFGNPTATYTNVWNKLDPKENDEAGYMSCGNNTCSYIVNAGLTPTAGTFQEAINYFQGVGIYDKKSPITERCQKNFIIYVTDGLPSVNESGTAGSADSLMPSVLAKIDALRNLLKSVKGKDYNFDIKTYILGVGLSDEAKLKLDDMAVHGGAALYGKAYYADKPDELVTGLENIFSNIIENSYSYTSPSVPSVRMVDKDVLYISSFIPEEKSPFWMGTLKAFQLNSDGTLPVDGAGNPLNARIWDAGVNLKGTSPDARKIYTYVGGTMVDFTSANITKGDLGVATDALRDAVINYVRGNVQDTYDLDNDGNKTEQRPWKLGDIFHSNTVIVGSPSPYYKDTGFDGTGGFYDTNKSRTKVVIVGGNDGLLHAFNATTGVEEWAFIPNSLLINLKAMMFTPHTYYVDSTPKVSDVWFYSSPLDQTKGTDEWRTVLVCGLRKGGKHYFALDITDTLNPQYLWEFPHSGDPQISNYADFLNNTLGQSWSEPAIGKVKILNGSNLLERWVAFIGGGYDSTEKPGKDADVGRAFFVVDIKTGEIMKQFSGLSKMDHCFAAPPTAVDINLDGYIDKVYIGDLGGQMWVFDVSSDTTTNWTGQRLFRAPGADDEKHMIYYQPAVAFDKYRVPWVFFGTGNREDPNESSNPPERFYAVKDDGLGIYPRTEGELDDVTPDPQNTFNVASKKGWYLQLDKQGKSLEKVLAKPTLFNQLVYFTTYKNKDTDDPCSGGGVSSLYTVEYRSGGGALEVDELSELSGPAGTRSKEVGIGAPSTPVISVNVKAQGSIIIGTTSGQIYSQQGFSPSSGKVLLYWREVIP